MRLHLLFAGLLLALVPKGSTYGRHQPNDDDAADVMHPPAGIAGRSLSYSIQDDEETSGKRMSEKALLQKTQQMLNEIQKTYDELLNTVVKTTCAPPTPIPTDGTSSDTTDIETPTPPIPTDDTSSDTTESDTPTPAISTDDTSSDTTDIDTTPSTTPSPSTPSTTPSTTPSPSTPSTNPSTTPSPSTPNTTPSTTKTSSSTPTTSTNATLKSPSRPSNTTPNTSAHRGLRIVQREQVRLTPVQPPRLGGQPQLAERKGPDGVVVVEVQVKAEMCTVQTEHNNDLAVCFELRRVNKNVSDVCADVSMGKVTEENLGKLIYSKTSLDEVVVYADHSETFLGVLNPEALADEKKKVDESIQEAQSTLTEKINDIERQEKGTQGTIIAMATLGGLVGVAFIGGVIFVIYRRTRGTGRDRKMLLAEQEIPETDVRSFGPSFPPASSTEYRNAAYVPSSHDYAEIIRPKPGSSQPPRSSSSGGQYTSYVTKEEHRQSHGASPPSSKPPVPSPRKRPTPPPKPASRLRSPVETPRESDDFEEDPYSIQHRRKKLLGSRASSFDRRDEGQRRSSRDHNPSSTASLYY